MPLPACVDVKTTVPVPVSVTVVPTTVAGPLVTTNVTGNPELDVGLRVNDASQAV